MFLRKKFKLLFLIKNIKILNYRFSLLFFLSKYAIDLYKDVMMNYNCPLGEEKFSVDNLKYNENNLKLIEFIETTKEDIIKENTSKIAEDDEYEYFVEKD